MLTSQEERSVRFMDEALDTLAGLEIGRLGSQRFFPQNLTWRVVGAYDLPGKHSDGRVKSLLYRVAHIRVMRALRDTKNGLRLWIPIGGGQWQHAPAASAGMVRVFRNNYREIQQSAGARKEALDKVLADHAASGLGDDEPITAAYEKALA